MVTIGKKVQIFRLLRFSGSRQALAEAAGVDLGTIGRIERDTGQPHYSTISKIEAAIGLGLFDPDVEAAFAILADDEAKRELVIKAVAWLERHNGQ